MSTKVNKMSKNDCQGIKNHCIYLDVSYIPFLVSPFYEYPIRGRACAVVSVADYGPRGPGFEIWPGRRSFWP